MPRALLSDAIDEYLERREVEGYSPNTLRSDRSILKRMLTEVGNIWTHNVVDRHVTLTMKMLRKGCSNRSLSTAHYVLAAFWNWATLTARYTKDNPMAGRRPPTYVREERNRVAPQDFERLLEAATHPRDRMLIALHLYLLTRRGEVMTIKLGHVRLEMAPARILVRVHKGGVEDWMPVSEELDRELRRWLTFYAEECGELQDEWFLVPTYHKPKFVYDPVKRVVKNRLNPLRPLKNTSRVMLPVFEAIGFPIRDEQGKSLREGTHTIRRSGATALYEVAIKKTGGDRAMDIVQATLHHRNRNQTETYIGRNAMKAARDQLLSGNVMYPGLTGENVTRLRAVSGEDGH